MAATPLRGRHAEIADRPAAAKPRCRRHRHAQGPHELRRRRLLAVPAQGLHQGRGLHRRRARAAGDRHHRHRQRLQPLPRQHAAAGGGGAARHPDGRWPAGEVPHHLDRRELRAPDQHVPAQPDVDRHRGDDPRAADGRGGADRRLRQDGAGATDGRRVGRPAGDPARHRLDAHRLAPRRDRRCLHRLPALLGPLPRRRDRRGTRSPPSTTSWWPASAPAR